MFPFERELAGVARRKGLLYQQHGGVNIRLVSLHDGAAVLISQQYQRLTARF